MRETVVDLGTGIRRRAPEGLLVDGTTFGALGLAFGVLQVVAWDLAGTEVGGSVLANNGIMLGGAAGGAAVGVAWWWAVERRDQNGAVSGAFAGVATYPVAWFATGALLAATGALTIPPAGEAGATTATVGGFLYSEATTGLPYVAPLLGLAGAGIGATLARVRPTATTTTTPGLVGQTLADPPAWLPESARGWTLMAGGIYGVLGLVAGAPAAAAGALALAGVAFATVVGFGVAAAICWWGVVEVRSDASAVGGAAAGVAWGVLVHPATWTVYSVWTVALEWLGVQGSRAIAVTGTPVYVIFASLVTIMFLGVPTILVGAGLGVALAALRRAADVRGP